MLVVWGLNLDLKGVGFEIFMWVEVSWVLVMRKVMVLVVNLLENMVKFLFVVWWFCGCWIGE